MWEKYIVFKGLCRQGGSGRNVHRRQYHTRDKWKLKRKKLLKYLFAFHNALVSSFIYIYIYLLTHAHTNKLYETYYAQTHTKLHVHTRHIIDTTMVYACRRVLDRYIERER